MTHMFCTLKQAADRLETTEADVEAMLDEGALREFRDGHNRLVKVSDLAALASELCPAASGEDDPVPRPGAATHPGQAARIPGQHRRQNRPLHGAPTDQNMVSRSKNSRPRTGNTRSSVAMRPSSTMDSASREASAAERIRLPLTAAAIAGVRPSTPQPSRRPPSPTQGADRVSAHSPRVTGTDRRPAGPAAGCARPRRAQHATRKPGIRRHHGASAAASTPAFTPQRPRPQTQELSLREWIWMGLLDDRPHTILALFAAILLAACTVIGAAYLLMRTL